MLNWWCHMGMNGRFGRTGQTPHDDGPPAQLTTKPTRSQSLRSKTAGNLGYSMLSRVLIFALSSATWIILARRLDSSDYGIAGFAMIFSGLLGQFSDLGITSSVIQKETVEEKELYTAFTLKVLLSLLIFALSFFLGNISRMAHDNAAVKAVVIVLAAGFLPDSLGFLPTVALKRSLRFKRLTVPQVGSQTVATAVAIVAVYAGFRYWSIIFSSLAASVASAVIAYAMCPLRFRFGWDADSAVRHLKFGSHLFFAGLMGFVLFNADNFVVGAAGGTAALGFYTIAFRCATMASGFISQSIHTVLLPTFSRMQQEIEKLKRGYLTTLEYVSFGAVLANGLLLVLSRDILVLVLGAGTGRWLPALFTLEILSVYGVVRAILEPVGSMVVAIGRPALMFRSSAIVAALQAVCLYPAMKFLGTAGVAVVVTLSYSAQFLIYFPALHREIDLRYSMVLRSVRPAILAGCALGASGFALDRLMVVSWLSLFVKLLAGCSLYLIVYCSIAGWKIFKDGFQLLDAVLIKMG